jgi:hypothetical protein
MALQNISLPEPAAGDYEMLHRLLNLYEEERQLYDRVLELSRAQGDIVRRGGSLGEVRRILEQKKSTLEIISRLEMTEQRSKAAWEKHRHGWPANDRARVHQALQTVAAIIEEILVCEEKNDLDLIETTRVMA